ncbi:MAG TPA: transcriptional repressor [Tissierellia bacterium]|nr:transcriptional repressor [Tissierellia bacterium]
MDIKKQLTQHGYKLTKPRQLIIDVLQDNHDRLLSVESLYEALDRAIDLSTVYRNLEVLDACGLIYRVQSGDKSLFKLICQTDHHHHLICLQCGSTQVIDYCPLPELGQIARQHDFEVAAHTLEVFGYCRDCRTRP